MITTQESAKVSEQLVSMLKLAGFDQVRGDAISEGLLPRCYASQVKYESYLSQFDKEYYSKMDWVICDGRNRMFVEVKSQNSNGSTCDKLFRQVFEASYCLTTHQCREYALLTHGCKWETDRGAMRALAGVRYEFDRIQNAYALDINGIINLFASKWAPR